MRCANFSPPAEKGDQAPPLCYSGCVPDKRLKLSIPGEMGAGSPRLCYPIPEFDNWAKVQIFHLALKKAIGRQECSTIRKVEKRCSQSDRV